MSLDERKKAILTAIINDYINTAEPIGSRTVAKKHGLGLSSATIRNEMADLEELGYLSHPHTSAGRVPSDKGYRIYVDELMNNFKLTPEEARSIRESMEFRINEIGQLVKHISSIIARVTRYTTMAITPGLKDVVIKAVQVVPISTREILVIVVAGAGIVRNCLVKLPVEISADNVIVISNVLGSKLKGLSAEKISAGITDDIEKEVHFPADILASILTGVKNCIRQIDSSELYLEGATNIFNFPEFKDVIKAQEFLSILDEKNFLHDMLQMYDGNKEIRIKIGAENERDEIKDYSLITATYSINDEVLGSIGVIGPTRMQYSKVISSLNYIRKRIAENFSETESK
ncbi:MAG: heat-inducible transcriptional repressor HrcA [Eubacteriales bacterium]|nr:heat-inducible transcriptional repressor HrcA [Eubacteriales bacterium]